MKKQRKNFLDNVDFRELERLVLQEIDSFERRKRGGQPCEFEDGDHVGHHRTRVKERMMPARIRLARGEKGPAYYPQEHSEPTGDVGDAWVGGDVDIMGTGDRTEFLGEEDEKFISDAVEWLRPRENKDTIIARIWSILTDSQPEAFFSPERDETPERPERNEADADEAETGTPENGG